MFEAPDVNISHQFWEKKIIAINIRNASIGGVDGDHIVVPFSYCEVYAPAALLSDVRDHINIQLMSKRFGVPLDSRIL